MVSRLVAAAFCDNPDPIHANTVDHIDGNKENNTASNLRWMTLQENVREHFKHQKAQRHPPQEHTPPDGGYVRGDNAELNQ